MADAPRDETTDRATTRPGGSWPAVALAVLAWCLAPIAVFIGIGEPRPGPDYERALAHKATLTRGLYGAALSLAAAAFVAGVLARARGRRGGLVGVFVGGALLACTIVWWLVAR
jgi:hypothetical protein